MQPAIRVENLGKRCRLQHADGLRAYKTFRETLSGLATAPLHRLRKRPQPTTSPDDLTQHDSLNRGASDAGRKGRLDGIDVLRGFAAVWVVLYHLWNRYYPGLSTQSHSLNVPAGASWRFHATFFTFQYGYVGVTLFFVLSGFCIHLPQARRHASAGQCGLELTGFLKKRFWRLYPAYSASLLLTAGVSALFPALLAVQTGRWTNVPGARHVKSVVTNAMFLQQLNPDSLAFNGVYWTLLYEVQFYAFYPLLLIVTRRCGLTATLVTLISAEFLFAFYHSPVSCFFLDKYYEWFLGMVAAELYVKGRIHIRIHGALMAALPLGILATLRSEIWPLRDLLLSTGFFGLLLCALQYESSSEGCRRFTHVLFIRPLVTLGLVSYSLYLIHVPLIDVVWTGLRLLTERGYLTHEASRSLALLSVPTAFVAACAWYRCFELPFMRIRQTKRVADGALLA